MSGAATPAATPAPAATGPVKVDALNPSVVIPVYLGGEGPVPTPPPGDRGDFIAPAAAAAAPEAQPPPPQGTVAAAIAAEAAAAEPHEL